MDYIKIRIIKDLEKRTTGIEETMEQLFESIRPMFSISEQKWKPLMDVYETEDQVIVLAALANVDKEDIRIEANARVVRISGVRCPLIKDSNMTFCLAEVQYGKFERVLYLPAPVDTEMIDASFSNGFLQIRMAKIPVMERHKIDIND